MGVPAPLGVPASGVSPYPGDKANGVVQGTLGAVAAVSRPFSVRGPMNAFLWASFNTQLTVNAASLTAQVAAAGVLAAGASINSSLLPRGTTMSAITGTDITLVLPAYTYWGRTKAGIAKITGLPATNWLLGATVTGPGIPAATTVTAIDTAAVAPNAQGMGAIDGVVSISAAPTSADAINENQPFVFQIVVGAVAAGVDAAAIFTGASIVYNATPQLERSFDGGATWLPCNMGGSGVLAQWATATTGGVPVSFAFGEPESGMLYRFNLLAYTGIAGTTLNYRLSATGQAATSLSVPSLS